MEPTEALPEEPAPKSWVPWWIDPYSDNPIAFGILFLLVIVTIVGGMELYRYLFITNPGMEPQGPQYVVLSHLLQRLAERLAP